MKMQKIIQLYPEENWERPANTLLDSVSRGMRVDQIRLKGELAVLEGEEENSESLEIL